MPPKKILAGAEIKGGDACYIKGGKMYPVENDTIMYVVFIAHRFNDLVSNIGIPMEMDKSPGQPRMYLPIFATHQDAIEASHGRAELVHAIVLDKG